MDNETTASQAKLSDSMRSAWADFAKYPEDGRGWPMFGSQNRDLQVFDTKRARGGAIDMNFVDAVCT